MIYDTSHRQISTDKVLSYAALSSLCMQICFIFILDWCSAKHIDLVLFIQRT